MNQEITETQDVNIRKPLFSKKTRTFLNKSSGYLVLTLIALIFMIPLFWMISTSLKSRWDIFAWPPKWIPDVLHWENYGEAFRKYPLGRFMLNSSFLVVVNIIAELLVVPLVAYGFARLRFPGKKFLFLVLLGTMMLPGHIKLIPLYAIYTKLNWIDTYWPLIVPSFFGSPFFIFLLVQYMKTIPLELDEAARIDGAGTFTILYRIVLPLCWPALTIIIIFTFLWTWNEFMHPLIFLNSFEKYPIQVGLAFFRGRYSTEWNLFMAATLVTLLPVLIVYFFNQKRLIGGIASVGLKG
jgi:ABC-type glycerol-3-phosphate transport system permease component